MNKIAMITGAGSGVGRAVAKALAPQGWSLVLVGRKQETLEETARGPDRGPSGGARRCRRSRRRSRLSSPRLKDKFGRLDMLFNNAGMGTPAIPIEELTFEQWQAVVSVNLTGAFLCTQEAMRLMKAQDAARRAHHQQWLDQRRPAPAAQRALYRDQARHHRPDQIHHPGWAALRHHRRPDRHRQCRHRDDRAHDPGRAAARRQAEGGTPHGREPCRPGRWPSWRACRWNPMWPSSPSWRPRCRCSAAASGLDGRPTTRVRAAWRRRSWSSALA